MKLDPLEITDLYGNIGFAEGVIISLWNQVPKDSRPDRKVLDDSMRKLKNVTKYFDKLLAGAITNDT